ncbi:MAG: hypothetical protein ACD_7C00521G0001 [uncultured bacterium]|nr:MAG: hypothetical protein ACD_7C00521G0001 [uncultured bacterium]
MLLNANVNPTKTKHVVYIIVSTLLGILLSLLAHAGIEMLYLNWTERTERVITWYGGCALHPAIQIGLLVLGAVGGFFLGRLWWRLVYIERKWAKGARPHRLSEL